MGGRHCDPNLSLSTFSPRVSVRHLHNIGAHRGGLSSCFPLDVLHVRHWFAPRSLLTLGDWQHLFLRHLQDVSRLDQARDTKKPSEPISSSSSTDEQKS